jgi:DNA-binding transcriptional regulator YiaG
MTGSMRMVATDGTGVGLAQIEHADASGQGALTALLRACALAALLAVAAAQSTSTSSANVMAMRSAPSGATITVITPHASRVPWSRGIAAVDSAIAIQLVTVRRAFSLTIRQLATVMRVTRPVIYRWRDGETAPRTNHQLRISALARLAQQWIATGSFPVGLSLHVPFRGGPSLFELMSSEPVPLTAISEVLAEIAASQASRRFGRARGAVRTSSGAPERLRSEVDAAGEDTFLKMSASREPLPRA